MEKYPCIYSRGSEGLDENFVLASYSEEDVFPLEMLLDRHWQPVLRFLK